MIENIDNVTPRLLISATESRNIEWYTVSKALLQYTSGENLLTISCYVMQSSLKSTDTCFI